MNLMQQPTDYALVPNTGGASRNVSGHHFPEDVMPVAGHGVIVSFFYDRSVIDDPTNPETHGKAQTVLCVAVKPKGDRYTISHRRISEEMARRKYPREFQAFKEIEDVPDSGTPIAELPNMTASQIAELSIWGLRTVEDLLYLDEVKLGQISMDAIRARKLAEAWQKRREDAGDMVAAADIEARYKTALDAAEKRLAAMEASNSALTMKLDALMELSTGKPQASGQPQMIDDTADLPPAPAFDPLAEADDGDGPLYGGEVDPLRE